MPRLRMAFAVVTSSLVAASSASADTSCRVRIDGREASMAGRDPWERAAREVEAYTRVTPGDCASIEIHTAASGGTLELRTTDGRAARRSVETAEEVAPLVRALLTAVPAAPEEAQPLASAREAEPPPGVVAGTASPEPERPSSQRPTQQAPLFAAVGAGVSVPSGDGSFGFGHALAGVALGAWEIGGFGRWEFEHRQTESAAVATTTGAIGGGAIGGWRRPLGPTTLVLGGTLGVYATEQESSARHVRGARRLEHAFADPRAGVYAALLAPVHEHVRTRIQVGSELALVDRSGEGDVFAALPRWAFGLTLGVELGQGR